MKISLSNNTTNSSQPLRCVEDPAHVVFLSVTDVLTLSLGQPVVIRLLWITFSSTKTLDILNFNLALFHNVQHLICLLHLSVLFLLEEMQQKILRFMFVYVQIGGSMSLCLISLERYVAVIHPTSFPLLKKYRCREVCAVTVWLFSLTPAILFFLASDDTFIPESLQSNIPLYVMILMNAAMGWFSIRLGRALKKSGPGGDKLHPVKRRALTTVRATFIITFFCYLPVSVMERYKFIAEDLYKCAMRPAGIFCLSAASVVHPLFYLYTQGKRCR